VSAASTAVGRSLLLAGGILVVPGVWSQLRRTAAKHQPHRVMFSEAAGSSVGMTANRPSIRTAQQPGTTP
jgi:hypothetical protein